MLFHRIDFDYVAVVVLGFPYDKRLAVFAKPPPDNKYAGFLYVNRTPINFVIGTVITYIDNHAFYCIFNIFFASFFWLFHKAKPY